MVDILVTIGLLIGLLAVFTIPIGMFNTKMFRGLNDEKPGGLEFIKAYIPFYNVRYARVLAYNTSPVFLVFLIFATLLFLTRFVALAMLVMDIGFSAYLIVFTPVCVLAALLIWWILAAINAIDFGRMIGVGGLTLLFSALIPPLGYYMLSVNVLPYFKKEETSLHGTFGSED